jgi:hypothetical protein
LGNTSLEDCCDPLYLWVINRRHSPLLLVLSLPSLSFQSPASTGPCLAQAPLHWHLLTPPKPTLSLSTSGRHPRQAQGRLQELLHGGRYCRPSPARHQSAVVGMLPGSNRCPGSRLPPVGSTIAQLDRPEVHLHIRGSTSMHCGARFGYLRRPALHRQPPRLLSAPHVRSAIANTGKPTPFLFPLASITCKPAPCADPRHSVASLTSPTSSSLAALFSATCTPPSPTSTCALVCHDLCVARLL